MRYVAVQLGCGSIRQWINSGATNATSLLWHQHLWSSPSAFSHVTKVRIVMMRFVTTLKHFVMTPVCAL
jgi:hypothetical protein